MSWIGYNNYDHYFTFDRVYEWLEEIKNSQPAWIHFKKKDWWNIPASFDIETSSFEVDDEKYATMYLWSMCINGSTVIGRTWKEFSLLIKIIENAFHTNRMKLVIYVHNLSYEFQWMRKYLDIKRTFSIKNRHILSVTLKNGIIFKCSYKLSNYALAYIGDSLITRYKVAKDVGNLDYQLVRHSASQLADSEIWYNVHDVQVVTSYIQEKIENEGSIAIIPLTNTGYVRNYARECCFSGMEIEPKLRQIKSFLYHDMMRALQLVSVNEYNEQKEGFAGGYTHSSMLWANKEEPLKGMKGADLCSSYPTACCAEKFPMGRGVFVGRSNIDKLHELRDKGYCFICMITLYDVNPEFIFEGYISLSKCLRISDDYVVNNGRVYSASQLAIVITDVDLGIIEKCYSFNKSKVEVDSLRYYHSDYLPKSLIQSILKLYSDKTTLKDVPGKEVEYMVSKGMLNSCYGMMVTDIVRDEVLYEDDKWSVHKADAKTQLDIYNNSYNRFLFYPWGVWVTAYARRNLWSAIFEFKEDYVYVDTDSIKGFHFENHMKYFEEYNSNITKKLETMCDRYKISKELIRPLTKKGKPKPLGVWEIEADYNIFKTLGAKRYIYEINGILSHTISGVNKRYGVPYLLNEYGYKGKECDRARVQSLLKSYYNPTVDQKDKKRLDKAEEIIRKLRNKGILDYENVLKHFTNHLVFPKEATGKSTLTYLDEPFTVDCYDYNGVLLRISELSAIHMEQQEYRMQLDDYEEFLRSIRHEET